MPELHKRHELRKVHELHCVALTETNGQLLEKFNYVGSNAKMVKLINPRHKFVSNPNFGCKYHEKLYQDSDSRCQLKVSA